MWKSSVRAALAGVAVSAAAVLAPLAWTPAATAQDRVVIDETPTADEFATMLFGDGPPPGVKMRGIAMHDGAGAPSEPAVVAAPVNFAFNSADIPPEFEGVLASLAQAMLQPQAQGRMVIVAGHTDPVGGAAYNLALSERRAQAVAAYLIQLGVPAGRIQPVGMGEQALLSPEDNALNRRVEFQAAPQ